MKLFDYFVHTKLPSICAHGKIIVNTINPHSYCVAKTDKMFKQALLRSDVLLPDGIGIVLGAKLLVGKRIRRITGSDLHIHALKAANEHKLKVFYLGASNATLSKIQEKVSVEYPYVTVGVYSPPFKIEFSDEDNAEMVSRINEFAPHILFVGMTAPKQEKWVFKNEHTIQANVICSIGAVFDFYAGLVKRPSEKWQKIGLEWLPRFLNEPKRLLKRNLISSPQFMFDILSYKLKMLFSKSNEF